MRRKNFSVALLLLFAATTYASTTWYKGNFNKAKAAAASLNKPVLVFFYSDN